MIVEMAVLADYANMADGGKLNVLGMFDQIWGQSFPLRHPAMVLALRLRLGFDDRDATHTILLELVNEDGQQLVAGGGQMVVGSIPPGHREISSQLLPFENIEFPAPGEYSFILRWNGIECAKVPLTVGPATSLPAKSG